MAAREWFVYLAGCGDGTRYAGIAKDVERRIAAHDAGTGARYTRGRGPVTLLAAVGPLERGDALRLELRVKRAKRPDKLAVLEAGAPEAGSPTEAQPPVDDGPAAR